MAKLIILGVNSATGQESQVHSGDAVVDTSGNLILAGGVELLSETNGIDGTSATTTNLYTVPTGIQVIITEIVVRVVTATSVTVVPTLGIGIASGEDDIVYPQALVGLSSAGDIFSLDISAKSVIANAGDVIKVGIDTGATASSLLLSIDIIGYVVGEISIPDPTDSWVSYSPAITWSGGVGTLTSRYRITGKMLEIFHHLPITGAITPTSTSLDIDLPAGVTVNTFGTPGREILQYTIGQSSIFDSGVEYLTGPVNLVAGVTATDAIRPNVSVVSGTYTAVQDLQHNQPFTFASGDIVAVYSRIPIY